MINKDQTQAICRLLKNPEARVFWLSYFKSQLAVSADEFIGALHEYCSMNQVPEWFEAQERAGEFKALMVRNDFTLSLANNGQEITSLIFEAHQEAARRYRGASLLSGDQVRFPGGGARSRVGPGKNEYINEGKLT